MKIQWRLLASLLAVSAIPLFADADLNDCVDNQETVQYGNRKKQYGKKNEQPTPEEKMVQMQPTITPSVYPYISEGTNTYATLDFIWWKSVIAGTEYAFTGVADNYQVTFGESTGQGSMKNPPYQFEPGFKAGLGVHFDHDGWDLYAQFTYLAGVNGSNTSETSPGTGGLTLSDVTFGDGDYYAINYLSDRCELHQDFNVIDLELGRNFFISKHLTLRPHAGLKTGWIHENLVLAISPIPGYTDGDDDANVLESVKSTRGQNLWGIGIRGGMDTMWHINKNWALYADLAFATFWGDFHIKATNTLVESVSGQYEPLDTRESLQAVIPVIEAGLGLAYITWWDNDNYRAQIQAGWEEQVWLDFNHFMDAYRSGSLSLQGLTVRGTLTF